MEGETFSKAEYARYSRHFILPEINTEGQQKMKQAKVLVVGAGGLGSPILLYLAAAGIGTIGIVDFDVVDETNLQRQVIFSTTDVGKSKALVAKERILQLNPHVHVIVYQTKITSSNALEIIPQFDVVVDGTDNFPTRYLLNDACVFAAKPNVFGSIFRFEGQVAVFNYLYKNGERSPNYRDVFPNPPAPGEVPNCAEGGVLGVLPGMIGCIQANEVIKVVCGIGEVLAGKLFLIDTLSFLSRTIKIKKRTDNPISGEMPTLTALIDYEEFCNVKITSPVENATEVKEMDVKTLHQLLKSAADNVILIDVRAPYEYEISNLGGKLIPLSSIETLLEDIPKAEYIVFHCRTGQRSLKAIKKLQAFTDTSNFYNLEGGILKWIDEIDNTLTRY
ncbi:MAG: molybdopterin-synthase adenylyltransferase MoeB [Bacteroidota bacterium]